MMRCDHLLAALAVCASCTACSRAIDLPETKVGRGGVAFDFKAISEKRFAGVFDASRNIAKTERSGTLTATKTFTFDLPHTNGGIWRVSCRYKLRHEKAGQALFAVKPGGYFLYTIPESGDEWSELSERAKVPAGQGKVTLTVNLNQGKARFDYRDLTVIDETPRVPVETMWTLSDNMDGTFAVSEGQVCEMEFYWRKTSPAAKYLAGDFTGRLVLPPGISFVGSGFADEKTVKTTVRPDGSSETTFAVSRFARAPADAYVGYGGMALALKATRGPGTAGEGRLTFDYRGKSAAPFTVALRPVTFLVIPRIGSVTAPVRYANGVMPGGSLETIGGSAAEELASFMGGCGVTWLVGRASAAKYAAWRKAGISRLTPGIWPCVDGFHVCGHKPIPESDRYVALTPDCKPTTVTPGSVCPVTVYEKSEYFRTVTVPFMRDYIKGTDGCWANWEPGSYAGKGCFCDRCCRKFAEYVGEPYETVKAAWPKCVMKGGRWFDRIQKFRSLEHAKVVKTLDGVVREATGGEKSFGFIPAIAWIEMSSWWRPRNYAAEVQAIDYAGALGWMCPWGPYAAWETGFPYVPEKRKPLCQFLAARDIRATVDRDYPEGRRPKLMGLPQGRQCVHWMTQPESIALAMDSYFFNAWESTVLYFFPQGYDARYWERFADATGRAAKYESCVLDGRRVDGTVRAEPFGPYAANAKMPSAYLPDEKDVPMFQTVAWEKDGRRIVAVFNFWQKGEAFLRLKVSGLDGRVAVVDETGVLSAADEKTPLRAGADLAANGIPVVVPAARCRVFEFRTDGDWKDATSVLTDAAVRRLLESRRGALEKAAADDARRENANGPIVTDSMPVI